jgi:hypothetical protein
MLELKSAITEMKISLEGLVSKCEQAKDRKDSKYEDRAIETIESEKQAKKKKKKILIDQLCIVRPKITHWESDPEVSQKQRKEQKKYLKN